eukprot:1224828-Amphidinium_carterae.1
MTHYCHPAKIVSRVASRVVHRSGVAMLRLRQHPDRDSKSSLQASVCGRSFCKISKRSCRACLQLQQSLR